MSESLYERLCRALDDYVSPVATVEPAVDAAYDETVAWLRAYAAERNPYAEAARYLADLLVEKRP